MAKGADSEEFALLSGPRTGLKREFAFALKAQSEVVSGSFGRTRARNLDNNNNNKAMEDDKEEEEEEEEEEEPCRKRLKSSSSEEEAIDDNVEGVSVVDEPVTGLIGLQCEGERKNGDGVCGIEEGKDDDVEEDSRKEANNDNVEESRENGNVELVESVLKKFSRRARVTRSAVKHKGEESVNDDSSDGKPVRRFTRSSLEPKVDEMVMKDNVEVGSKDESVLDSEAKGERVVVDESCEDGALGEAPSCEDGALGNAPSCEDKLAEGNSDAQMAMDENVEVGNASEGKTLRRFTRSALKPKVDHVVKDVSPQETPGQVTVVEAKEDQGVRNDDGEANNASVEKTVEGPNATIVEAVAIPESLENASCEKITRRFTRSALEPKAVPSVMNGSNGPLAAKQNLEMRMSKKISLTKFPTTVKELLDTGMLEGFPVKYISDGGKKSVELRGTIRGYGILCSCTYCNDGKVVTPGVFELHAGSANKHPADNIYLENGNSLRDVLNACKDGALDTLETTIQEASKLQTIRAHTDVTETRLMKPDMSPKSLDTVLQSLRSQSKSTKGKITRKDLRLHKLVFEENGLPDGTELAYYNKGEKLLEGYKKGFGIFCRCCNSEVSPSTFEAHAGCASRRKPYDHIYTSNGVSLHELSLSLSKVRKFSPNDNDDLCRICGDCGDLLLCDGCPRAFHRDCVGQSSIPQGSWYCPYCQSMFRKEQSSAKLENALAAGRDLGVDPIEEITKRCIRIVRNVEPEVGGCALCRSHGFSKIGFGPRTVIICDQCEKEFHVGCLKDNKMADLKELPKGEWFCCMECNRIHSVLHKLIIRGSEELPSSISCVIKNKLDKTCLNNGTDVDARWRLLNGKVATPESRSLLSKAVTIFHDRFDPIVDSITGRDLIPSMVYGKKRGDQEYRGMYCAVLTINSSVVSAGILRIFGQEIAELPLVATSSDYQGQGYFQSLFSCIERLLGFMGVKNLVLPAAEEAEAIWVNKFGFQKMSNEQVSEYRRYCQVTTFQGTSMLQKPVPKCRIVNRSKKIS